MDYQAAIKEMSRVQYDALKSAVERGKWPDGRTLTSDQKAHCMRAIIAYGEIHLKHEERVGYIYTEKHDHCDSDDDVQPLNWK